MFSLSDMVRIVMISPPAPEHEHGRRLFGLETGPARFFRWRIGRGGFAGVRAASRAMPTLLRRIEKSEIDEAEIEAFRHRVGCA
jgi:hypothetical protein